jgi:hypothetical protein
MEAMRKEIARLNEIIGKGWLNGKALASNKKVDETKGPQFKHGLSHTKGAKTNGRKIVNGYECVQFERKDIIGVGQPTQTVAVPCRSEGRQCHAPQKWKCHQFNSWSDQAQQEGILAETGSAEAKRISVGHYE